MFNSTDLMMPMDRGLYELRTGNNKNTVALNYCFLIKPVPILFERPT